MSELDDLMGQDWYEDLPKEAKAELKKAHDSAAAAQRLLEKEKRQNQEAADRLAKIESEMSREAMETT